MSTKDDHFGAALWPLELPDGATKENVQAALQLAWLANDMRLSREIAERNHVYGRICLRCATNGTPILNTDKPRPHALIYHLCEECARDQARGGRRDRQALLPYTEVQDTQEQLGLAIDGILGERFISALWQRRR